MTTGPGTAGARLPDEWEAYLHAALEAVARAAPIQREWFRSDTLSVDCKDDGTPVTEADRRSEQVIRSTLEQAFPGIGFVGEEYGEEGSTTDRWIIDPIDGTKSFVAGLPYYATLIGLMLHGEIVLGVVHAPSLGPGSEGSAVGDERERGRTWWAVRGHGAFTGTGVDRATVQQHRLRVSDTANLSDASICHGGLIHFRRRGWEPFLRVIDRCARTRGFGDWWGHMLVAEGRCDAMIDPSVGLHDIAAVKPIVEEAGGAFHIPRGTEFVSSFRDAAFSSTSGLADELARLLEYSADAREDR